VLAGFSLKASAILDLFSEDLGMIEKLVEFNEVNEDDEWRAYRNAWMMVGLSFFVKMAKTLGQAQVTQ
jgi:hypothetical protein